MSADSTTHPQFFTTSIGGFPGPYYALVLNGDVLEYSSGDNDPKVAIEPTIKQWKAFRRSLDNLDVWNWRQDYQPESVICDGTSWSLDLGWGERHIQSSGSNSYPPNLGHFLSAVRRLIGNLEFS